MSERNREEMASELRGAIDAFGAEFMRDIIDVYLADAPRRLGDLRAAHIARDWQAFTRAAHTLKSSSSYVGARRFSDLAAAIERASPDTAGADLGDQVARLEQEYSHVKAVLEEVRSGL
jgi:two-component system sensor histidine kinase BarA